VQVSLPALRFVCVAHVIQELEMLKAEAADLPPEVEATLTGHPIPHLLETTQRYSLLPCRQASWMCSGCGITDASAESHTNKRTGNSNKCVDVFTTVCMCLPGPCGSTFSTPLLSRMQG
jgi:hypothetical protein